MTLVYDGSFEGFLTLVYEVYYKKLKVTKIEKEIPQSLFFDDIVVIETDMIKAQKVLDGIKSRFLNKNFENILIIFMCDTKVFELDLLHYIILGFKNQNELKNINHQCVFTIENLLKEYFRNNHKLSGFVRFCELDDGTLYAKVDSKFNCVYHLGSHFLKRFNNQNYIIHDIARKLAFIKNDSYIGVQEVAQFDEPIYSKDEAKFQKLWQEFFDAIAIKERTNLKLQQQMVPLLYRTYMNEF